MDVNFTAPAINGTANASSPELGAIILDTSSSTFYGNIGTPTSPNWAMLGGSTALNSWSGYMPIGSTWSTSSSTMGDPTNSGGNTLNPRGGSGITVAAASSSLPGITFTPSSSSSIYLVTAKFSGGNTAGANSNSYLLTDGTNTITTAWHTNAYPSPAGYDRFPIAMTGIYAPGTSSSVTVKIQMATNGGTGFIEPDPLAAAASIEWSVVQIK
jgi:hypothetical protein